MAVISCKEIKERKSEVQNFCLMCYPTIQKISLKWTLETWCQVITLVHSKKKKK